MLENIFKGKQLKWTGLLLAVLMLFTAVQQIPSVSAAEGGGVLAAWEYTNAPGTSEIPATSGVFEEDAVLSNFKDDIPDYSTRSLRVTDWTGDGERYWMIALSTEGYENLTLSNDQRSSGTAPRDFVLQYSLDAADWTDIEEIQPLTTDLTTVLDEFELPADLNDQAKVYLRWLVASNINVNGYEDDIRPAGTSNINNIIVSGDALGSGGGDPGELQELDFSVFATSDLHGRILNYDYSAGTEVNNYGLVKIASFIKNQRETVENMIVLDNGDTFQGTPMSLLFLGKEETHPMALAMRYIGYDGWVLGNHEFNYGMDVLNKFRSDLAQPAEFDGYAPVKTMSANIYYGETDEPYAEPYFIKSFEFEDGTALDVGVLALTTPNIPSWESGKNYEGLYFGGSFADDTDMAEEAAKWIAAMKEDGADIIVASVHSGIERTIGSSNESQIRGLIAGTAGIDAVIAGHSHSATGGTRIENKDGEDVIVVNPGNNGANVSQLDFSVEKDGDEITVDIASKNVAMNNTNAPVDEELNDILAPYQAEALDYNNTIIGEAGAFFPRPSVTEPSELVDIVHLAQMAAAPDAQVSVTAPLSMNVTFEKGPLSVKNAGAAYIYENTLYVIKMTGANIKGWMELVASRYRADGSFSGNTYNADSLYGMTYDIDLTAPEGSRIKNLRYEGKRVQPDDTFNVAINNYRFAGEYMTAAGLTPDDQSLVVWESTAALGSDEGQVRSMVINYIKEQGIVYPEIKSDWTLSGTSVEENNDEIMLDKTELTLVLGEIVPLKAAGAEEIFWSSSDAAIAAVDENGVVTAISEGKAEIKAASEDGRVYAVCAVTVSDGESTGLSLDLTSSPIIDDGFEISAVLSETVSSNAAILNFTYNTAIMDYSEMIIPEGMKVLTEEKTETGVEIKLMKQDYELKELPTLKMIAKESMFNTDEVILAEIEIAVKDENGDKATQTLTGSIALNGEESNLSADLNADGIVDLLDLSMIIDAFGIDDGHGDWTDEYKRMDFNKNGIVDIDDIVYIAKRLGTKVPIKDRDSITVSFTKDNETPVEHLDEAADANLNANIAIKPSEDETELFSSKALLFCAAVYDAEGRLFALTDARETTDANGEAVLDIAINIPENTEGMRYKLFIWDADTYEPVIEARTVS